MFKLAALIWIMLGTTLAGMVLTVIVTVPSLGNQAMSLIPLWCGAAILVAIPLSFLIAKRIQARA